MSTPPPPFGVSPSRWPFEPHDQMHRVPDADRGQVGGALFWLGSWPLIILGSTMVASLLVGFLADPEGTPDAFLRTYYVMLIATYLGVLWLFARWLKPQGLAYAVLDFRPARLGTETAYAAVLLALSFVFSITAVDIFERLTPEPLPIFRPPVPGESPLSVWFLVPAVVLLAPYIEEAVMRGYVLPALVVRMGGWVLPIVLSAVFFGLLHVFVGWPSVVYTTVLGLCAGIARRVTGRMWAPITLHMANNALAVANL